MILIYGGAMFSREENKPSFKLYDQEMNENSTSKILSNIIKSINKDFEKPNDSTDIVDQALYDFSKKAIELLQRSIDDYYKYKDNQKNVLLPKFEDVGQRYLIPAIIIIKLCNKIKEDLPKLKAGEDVFIKRKGKDVKIANISEYQEYIQKSLEYEQVGINKHRKVGGAIFAWIGKQVGILVDLIKNMPKQGEEKKTYQEIVESHKLDNTTDSYKKGVALKTSLQEIVKKGNTENLSHQKTIDIKNNDKKTLTTANETGHKKFSTDGNKHEEDNESIKITTLNSNASLKMELQEIVGKERTEELSYQKVTSIENKDNSSWTTVSETVHKKSSNDSNKHEEDNESIEMTTLNKGAALKIELQTEKLSHQKVTPIENNDKAPQTTVSETGYKKNEDDDEFIDEGDNKSIEMTTFNKN